MLLIELITRAQNRCKILGWQINSGKESITINLKYQERERVDDAAKVSNVMI
jgi:hypothetical protein